MNHTTLARSALFMLAALGASAAHADFAAATCDRDRGSHVDVLTSIYSQACYGYVQRDDVGRYVRTIALPAPMSGDVRATADARSVVFVANYLEANTVEALAQDPIVVRVYRDGALVAEHRLSALATRADLQESISHVRFAKTVGSVDAKGEIALALNGGATVTLDAIRGELRARGR